MGTVMKSDLNVDFARELFEKLKHNSPGMGELEFYEFEYALYNLVPTQGWDSVELESMKNIEMKVEDRKFYESIKTKKKIDGKIILDPQIVKLTQMLFIGLVTNEYPEDWVFNLFFFDIRGFLFFHRTRYFTEKVTAHFGGKPVRQFEKFQKELEKFQGIGYTDFKKANAEIDLAFIETVLKVVDVKGTPILLTLAGPTAAGKTEIIERLCNAFEEHGKKITTVEMDNFLIDRDARGEKPIGEETSHFKLFKQFLGDILQGKETQIPRYDFIKATSSHDREGNLRPGYKPLVIEPADIIFIEGNFPFQMKEINELIGIKVVYLTDDPVRLKRKWKRDIDYRKKYDPNFFLNRFYKTQFLRADDCYLLQMQVCEIIVDTTNASLWMTPELVKLIE